MSTIHRVILTEITAVVVLVGLNSIGINKPSPPAAPVQVVNLIGAAAAPAVQATIYSADWCTACKAYCKDVRKELPPDGWSVKDAKDKDAAAADVIIDKDDQKHVNQFQFEALPTTIIRKDGKEVKRIQGRITPDELTKQINAIAGAKP